MQTVKILSFYGSPIFLDQCKKCGGIWFDQSELFRVKPGESEKIELLDSDNLRNPVVFGSDKHFCPRDNTALIWFKDPNFPVEILVERCPQCEGFWLNRGAFSRYQKIRADLMRPKAKTAADLKLEEDIKQIFELQQKDAVDNPLNNLARFLSQPMDKAMSFDGSAGNQNQPLNQIGGIINILSLLLRLFVFKH